VNGEGKSKPFTIYQTIEGELPKQFILRLDSAINKNGEAALKISNGNIGLVVSHQPEYIEGVLEGYKRYREAVGYVNCELAGDILPKAIKILINAVNDEGKSKPFTIYQTIEDELPRQFVLRIDSDVNRNGKDVIKASNSKIGLIVLHQPGYLEGVLTGYRRDVEGVECIICEKFVDDIPSVASAKKAERKLSEKKDDSWIDRLYAWADENDICDSTLPGL
jgi:hypothetical protein